MRVYNGCLIIIYYIILIPRNNVCILYRIVSFSSFYDNEKQRAKPAVFVSPAWVEGD
jgi:hypothetical protein